MCDPVLRQAITITVFMSAFYLIKRAPPSQHSIFRRGGPPCLQNMTRNDELCGQNEVFQKIMVMIPTTNSISFFVEVIEPFYTTTREILI